MYLVLACFCQVTNFPSSCLFCICHSNWCFASPLDKKNLKLISLPLESQPPYQLGGNCQVLCWIIQTFQTINTNFINYLLPHYIVLFYLCSAIFFDNTNLHLSTSSTRGWWVLGFCVLIINSVDWIWFSLIIMHFLSHKNWLNSWHMYTHSKWPRKKL